MKGELSGPVHCNIDIVTIPPQIALLLSLTNGLPFQCQWNKLAQIVCGPDGLTQYKVA